MRPVLCDLLACPRCGQFPLMLFVAAEGPAEAVPREQIRCDVWCPRSESRETAATKACSDCLDIEISLAVLVCGGCSRWYPVREGLPSVLPDDHRSARDWEVFDGCREIMKRRIDPTALLPVRDRSESAAVPADVPVQTREVEVRDRESRRYDSFFPEKRFRAELESYERIFRPAVGVRVLDVGIGTGRVARRLLDRASFVVGVDFSRESLVECRRSVAPELRGHLHLLHADAGRLPFRSAVFEHVISLGLLCNLPGAEPRQRCHDEIVRVLTDRGELLLSTYNHSWMKRIRGRLGLAATGAKEGWKADGVYYYNHDPEELRTWLSGAFEISELIGIDNRLPVLQFLLPRLTSRIDRALSESPLALPMTAREILVAARKRRVGSAPSSGGSAS